MKSRSLNLHLHSLITRNYHKTESITRLDTTIRHPSVLIKPFRRSFRWNQSAFWLKVKFCHTTGSRRKEKKRGMRLTFSFLHKIDSASVCVNRWTLFFISFNHCSAADPDKIILFYRETVSFFLPTWLLWFWEEKNPRGEKSANRS